MARRLSREEREYYAEMRQQNALEQVSDDLDAALDSAVNLVGHLDGATAETSLPRGLLNRTIGLLNKAIDLQDAITRLRDAVDEKKEPA